MFRWSNDSSRCGYDISEWNIRRTHSQHRKYYVERVQQHKRNDFGIEPHLWHANENAHNNHGDGDWRPDYIGCAIESKWVSKMKDKQYSDDAAGSGRSPN